MSPFCAVRQEAHHRCMARKMISHLNSCSAPVLTTRESSTERLLQCAAKLRIELRRRLQQACFRTHFGAVAEGNPFRPVVGAQSYQAKCPLHFFRRRKRYVPFQLRAHLHQRRQLATDKVFRFVAAIDAYFLQSRDEVRVQLRRFGYSLRQRSRIFTRLGDLPDSTLRGGVESGGRDWFVGAARWRGRIDLCGRRWR